MRVRIPPGNSLTGIAGSLLGKSGTLGSGPGRQEGAYAGSNPARQFMAKPIWKIVCGDAVKALFDLTGPLVTSPPDAAEIGMPIDEWGAWFKNAIGACLEASAHAGYPAVFYVTDRKANGGIESKAETILNKARLREHKLLWHKIALRRQPGKIDLHRPGYTHIIAIGGDKTPPGPASPDVIDRGAATYANGMGGNAAAQIAKYIAHVNGTVKGGLPPVLAPFCGQGLPAHALAAAGLGGIAIDIDRKQCGLCKERLSSVAQVSYAPRPRK